MTIIVISTPRTPHRILDLNFNSTAVGAVRRRGFTSPRTYPQTALCYLGSRLEPIVIGTWINSIFSGAK